MQSLATVMADAAAMVGDRGDARCSKSVAQEDACCGSCFCRWYINVYAQLDRGISATFL